MKFVDADQLLSEAMGRVKDLGGKAHLGPLSKELADHTYPILIEVLNHISAIEEDLAEGMGPAEDPWLPAEEADQISAVLKAAIEAAGGMDKIPDALKTEVAAVVQILADRRAEADPEESDDGN